MVKPNEGMLLPSEDVDFLAILGEFWSWEHPQPTSRERNLSKAKDIAAQMTMKSLPNDPDAHFWTSPCPTDHMKAPGC